MVMIFVFFFVLCEGNEDMVVILIIIVMYVIDSRLRIFFNLKELNFFLSE